MLNTTLARRVLATGAGAAMLSVGAFVAPADAATRQDGLVNVALVDTTVQVPIAVAANVCGVAVNVLAAGSLQAPVNCTSDADGEAIVVSGSDSGNTRQSGLVNVYAENTTIQVPVAVAANVCGIAVNVLSGPTAQFPVNCETESGALSILG
jgi:hypothetical protein